MTTETEQQAWLRLRELAASGDRAALDQAIAAMEPNEAIRVILRLEPEDQNTNLW